MWCGCCQQDVPAVAAFGERSQVRCARCGELLNRRQAASPPDRNEGATSSSEPLKFSDSSDRTTQRPSRDWQLDDELREAQRLVEKIKAQSGRANSVASNGESQTSSPQRPPTQNTAQPPASSALSWSLSGLGLSGLVCGCALLVWSLVAQRDELWTIGLPIALVSQVVLICGVLLRRDGVVTSSHAEESRPSATYVQVQSSAGAMQPSGLSVHFSNSAEAGGSLNTDQLRREIEAVMQRRAA